MMDRWKQRLQTPQPKSPDDDPAGADNKDNRDDDWGSGSSHEGNRGHHKGRRGGGGRGNPSGNGYKTGGFRGWAGRKDPDVDELVTIEVSLPQCCNLPEKPDRHKPIQVASKRDVLPIWCVRLPNPCLVHSLCSNCSEYKSPAPRLSIRAINTYTFDECLPIVLTSEIGRGATGIVHRGTLKLENVNGSVLLDMVVKLAFDSVQRDMLRTEYKIYRRLRSKGVIRGITATLGLFDDTEGGPCALVMIYAGDSLFDDLERILSVSDWWVS
jgi:hypothetical protein